MSYEVMVRLNRSLTYRIFLSYIIYIYIMTTPKIEPINIKYYTVKQSNYETVGKLPTRSIVLGPRWSGKSDLLC